MDYPRSPEEHRAMQQRKRYAGANVRFFDAILEDPIASHKEGRPIFKTIPSIEIQWPGMDKTVRAIEPQDSRDYPELYDAYKAGNEMPTIGTPLEEWALLPRSVVEELKHFGVRTVEQLGACNDDFKRRLGPLVKYCKEASRWLEAANSDQHKVAALEKQLEREQKKTKKLEEQVGLLMQRIEAVEGTRLSDSTKRSN